MPARNLIHPSSVPSTADPMKPVRINWPTVPTTISERAVEMRSQIENRAAVTARPSHNAASAHTPVMLFLAFSSPAPRIKRQQKNPPAAGHARLPPLFSAVGVISRHGGFGGLHPHHRETLTGAQSVVNAAPPRRAASARRDDG